MIIMIQALTKSTRIIGSNQSREKKRENNQLITFATTKAPIAITNEKPSKLINRARPFTLMDPAFVCFSDDQLRLSGSHLEHFLNTVVFPPLCAFGIVGNTLTIMVLVSNDLMSRLVVGVCFERVIGVRSPLHRLVAPSKRRLVAGIFNWFILVASEQHQSIISTLAAVRDVDASSERRTGGCHTVGVPRRVELYADVLREEKVYNVNG
ncbi:hypothetical protein TELCIR_11278 [Teladorsagia circumcincta]|uniref:G-protein coupled receptors family 1 profile domain-containing protein n=1 Tax=Teladorsagia circumcincta TaxID=45464 RepID=A0A2G9UB69_TELCI|nr:hypothetical protein TELCIR_11278 [Teladorsagia circumcincta]